MEGAASTQIFRIGNTRLLFRIKNCLRRAKGYSEQTIPIVINIPNSDTRDTVITVPHPHYLTADLLTAKRVQVDFLFPSPHQKLPTRVRHQRHTKGEDARVMAFGQLPVILEQQVTQCDLDLVGSKETSWAGMLSVSKSYLLRPRITPIPRAPGYVWLSVPLR